MFSRWFLLGLLADFRVHLDLQPQALLLARQVLEHLQAAGLEAGHDEEAVLGVARE